MTELLYFKDSHQKIFEAKVLSCVPFEDNYHVVLDQTAFFPEGGGQKPDQGTLGSISVLDVQIKEGVVTHTLASPLQEGKYYTGEIDWDKRFNRMQNHSGEHIVSGIVHNIYGYDNVGFHMADDVVTIDFNGVLDWQQLEEVEEKANQVLWNNVPVNAWFPTDIELQTLDYRSKKELSDAVRLVQIGDVDLCACCAPHVSYTGEIGIIKILSCMKHRGGVRIEMIAGNDAFRKLIHDYNQVRSISQMLSAKHDEISSAVERVVADSDSLKQTIYELRASIFDNMICKYEDVTSRNICEFNTDLSDAMCREFVNKLTEKADGIVGVFTGNDENGYKYIIGSKSCNLRDIIKGFNENLCGKGGGSPTMMQGTVSCTKMTIKEFFKTL